MVNPATGGKYRRTARAQIDPNLAPEHDATGGKSRRKLAGKKSQVPLVAVINAAGRPFVLAR